MFGTCPTNGGNHEKIAPLSEGDKRREVFIGNVVTLTSVVISDLHIKPETTLSNGSTNITQTELLAAHTHSQGQGGCFIFPMIGTNKAITPSYLSGAREQQAPSDVGHAVIENLWGVADLNVSSVCRFDI